MTRLTANGYPVDTSSEAFGELRDSTDLLADPAALRKRMVTEGTFFSGP